MNQGKKKILVFSGYYLPGYRGGGPIRSLSNMIDVLSGEFDFYVVTSDHDLGSSVAYEGVTSNAWCDVGSAKVYYARRGLNYFKNALILIRELKPDLIYLNSFFSFSFSIYVVILRFLGFIYSAPILLAPRGEFSLGALRLKQTKKLLFIRFVKLLGFYSKVRWHASTDHEAVDISRVFEKNIFGFFRLDFRIETTVPISVVPDIARINFGLPRDIDIYDNCGSFMLDICFLSRISPKKNLLFALKILAKVDFSVKFTVYGPVEDVAYWSSCLEFIKTMPPNVTVIYAGAVRHEDVFSRLSSHDLFFLPTLGENFGHVFLEAWAAGLVVIVSDQTPWRFLNQHQVGWDISLDSEHEFIDALTAASRFNRAEWTDRKSRSAHFASVNLNRSVDLSANTALLRSAINGL